MAADWERILERWQQAALVDAETAHRIRIFETTAAPRAVVTQGPFPALLAASAGAVLLGAGVLLFVAAHWDALSPTLRVASVLAMVAAFHVGGALSGAGFPTTAAALHVTGTVALGAGIYLVAQTFHLPVFWPAGMLLWSVGAWMGVALRRDWPHIVLVGTLMPGWLAAEWMLRTRGHQEAALAMLAQGTLLLAITYLSAPDGVHETRLRHALGWLGRLALLPAAVWVGVSGSAWALPMPLLRVGMLGAFVAPLALAAVFRDQAAVWNGVAAVWVLGLGEFGGMQHPLVYLWAGLGAAGLVTWGFLEGRRERVNLGVAAFLITVGAFYVSSVMDKLERSASLIGLGVFCLVIGGVLESARRWLLGHLEMAERS